MREESDLQKLAWAFQDIADVQRERARMERECAAKTEEAMGITLNISDITDMWVLLTRFSRGGMNHIDMTMEAFKFIERHTPTPTPPIRFHGGEE